MKNFYKLWFTQRLKIRDILNVNSGLTLYKRRLENDELMKHFKQSIDV